MHTSIKSSDFCCFYPFLMGEKFSKELRHNSILGHEKIAVLSDTVTPLLCMNMANDFLAQTQARKASGLLEGPYKSTQKRVRNASIRPLEGQSTNRKVIYVQQCWQKLPSTAILGDEKVACIRWQS